MPAASVFVGVCLLWAFLAAEAADKVQRRFAAFTISEEGPSTPLGFVPQSVEQVYLAYYSGLVDVYGDAEEERGRNLFPDNVHPGLSILSYPKQSASESVGSVRADATVTLESWCFAVTSFFLSSRMPRVAGDADGKCTLDLFYHRCLGLNGHADAEDETDYRSCLVQLSSTSSLEDVYMFEKWSRRCPKPLYADSLSMNAKAAACNGLFSESPSVASLVTGRHCYLHDLLTLDWIPYSEVQRQAGSSLSTMINPDKVAANYMNTWRYLQPSKSAEFQMGFSTSVSDFHNEVMAASSSTKAKNISAFLANQATNVQIRYVIAAFTNRDGVVKSELSFGVAFDSPASVDVPEFDFITPAGLPAHVTSSVLGMVDPLMRESSIKADVGYSEFHGRGQHRSWIVSITLDVLPLKKMLGFPARLYLRVVHMLERSLFLDNDELNGWFARLESEDDVTKIEASPVELDKDRNVGVARLRTLRTPFIDIEQHEMHCAPILYYGYVAVDGWAMSLDRLEVQYTLMTHTRYMHMNKGLTQELLRTPGVRALKSVTGWRYDLTFVNEPLVYVLDSPKVPSGIGSEVPATAMSYVEYLRGISFMKFVGRDIADADAPALANKTQWRRIYTTNHASGPSSESAVEVCKPKRTGLAFVGRVFSMGRCAGTRHRVLKIAEQQGYVVFSTPVGKYSNYNISVVATFIATVLVTIVSVALALRGSADLVVKEKKH
ncbi:membrane protein, putative [Babesia bigemina]|uniref:Membrane protein, putative n=1 Tax=Babesia bigemina TaxID=5866 RepID=A0A061CZ22_BABBI|nr:membrane protein, putative [Babesia bigemina]CDR93871.1 membrane protein, putative [Babesia bigemina]|eukprot:XP_012766057.1 membrane protein, putative [Babesia bigemina]